MASKSLNDWCVENKREDILNEWCYSRNTDITPQTVSYGNNIKVWWCCPKGHEWETRVSHRTYSNSGCPFCAGEKAIAGVNDLETIAPELCREWNYEKNSSLLPSMILPKSEKTVWWRCSLGHEWEAPVFIRYKGTKCPYCSNRKVLRGFNDFQTMFPLLAEEWDYSKNVEHPFEVSGKSATPVWWVDSLGHSWNARISDRVKGQGCLYCSGKRVLVGFTDLKTLHPELCLEWNYQKNEERIPEMFTSGSNKKVWWICKEGHEWESTISNRVRGSNCPTCGKNHIKSGINDFATRHPELLEEWDYEKNVDVDPRTIPSTGSVKYWWKCKYAHSWQASLDSRLSGSGCPVCGVRQRTSFPEQAIFYYLSKSYPDAQNGYTGIFDEWKGSELDIYIPSESVGIEYDGMAWHKTYSSNKKEKKKYAICKKHGIKLIRFKEEQKDSDNEVCDAVLYINYSTNYEDLNNVIPKLKQFLEVPDDIDVVRDREKIKELYYGVLRKHSLTAEAPLLSKEWNYERNGLLTPDMFMIGSSDKVWWRCNKGHEWKASINSRYQGIGCPFCSNKRVLKGYNDLSTSHPELLLEWDYQMNTVKPDEISYGYSRKIWWKCKKGHSWQAPPYSRAKGSGCPYCAEKKTLQGYNDLATVNPELCAEWDYEKNGDLMPSMLSGNNGDKVWWRCKFGHSWQATVNHRAKGTGCPICAGRVVLRGFNDLESLYPSLAQEWNADKNGVFLPSMVTPRSDKKVWWKCEKGHEWQASVSNRVAGTKCPYCSGKKILPGFNDIATVQPELLEIWDYKKNQDISPNQVGIGSSKKVWWKCEKGHEWQAVIYSKARSGKQCPKCNRTKQS